jgi:hypothetical protein
MTALEATNGHVPQQPHDFDEHDRQLAGTLETQVHELKGREHLASLLERSKQRERRLTRAITALESGAPQATTTTATTKTAAAKAKKLAWTPSEATVQRVFDGFQRYTAEFGDEPFTMTVLAKWMGQNGEGVGGETVRRAVEVLRSREQLRKCGTTRGGGALWALMPEHDAR